MRHKTILIAGIVLIIAAGVWLFVHPAATPSSHPVFQPEAQPLQGSTTPAQQAHADTVLPYAYQTLLCTTHKPNETQLGCMTDYYKSVVHTYGIAVAFSDLKRRYGEDPFVATMCHPLTHVIGREAMTLYPTIAQAYLHGDSFCWSGYYHGVLESAVKTIGRDGLTKQINTVCADLPGKTTYSFEYYNCVHGLGHGVMGVNGDDLFVALGICDRLTGDWERQSCYSGVFMENVMEYVREGVSHDLKLDEPLYPCTAVNDKYKYQCYLGQTSFVLSLNGGDFKKTFDLCAVVEGAYRAVCNQSLGRDAANYANHDGATTKGTCELASDGADVDNCVIGAVKEFISYYHAIDQANAFCSLFAEPEKTSCLTTSAQYFTIF